MLPTITAFSVAILTLIYIALSIAALRRRKAVQIAIGDGDDKLLQRRIRAHGNFQEYVPISLITLGFFELLGAEDWLVMLCASCLIIGRLLHAFGVSQVREKFIFRILGMSLTFATMIIASIGTLLLLAK